MNRKFTFPCTKISLFFWIAVILVFQNSNAQEAPGGIATNLKLWLKANTAVTPSTQGVAVTGWNDQSGGNNNASYSTPIFSLAVLNPTYQENVLNFNPTVRFAGTSGSNFAAIGGNLSPALTSNNISAYTVFLMNSTASTSARGLSIAVNSTASDWQGQSGCAVINRSGTSVTSYRNSAGGPIVGPVINTPVITSLHFTTGNQWRAEINGNPFTNTAFTTISFNSGYYRLGQSTYSSNDWFNGDIAEVILYDADQSSLASHNQIESYLALKYGIHKTGSYVNSANATIWNATANSAFHNDVFGIGRDDATGLMQVQSNSTNTGSGNGTGQSGKGNIVISNPSSLGDNGYLIIGHNTSSLSESVVADAGNTTRRVQRLWKVQNTGTTGTVSLSYDTTGLSYSALTASDFSILVDLSGTGTFNGDSVQYRATTLAGNKATFDNVNLPDGAVFTFQTFLIPFTPTTQATNVTFTNTTATTTTANWTNGNGNLRSVFMYAGTSGTAAPADLTTYYANPVFGAGTQIGTTGWYSIYKGTGTTVNVSGLSPATTYQVMTVEQNGAIPGNETYFTTVSTGNPAGVTTLSNDATLSNLTTSDGTLNPTFDSATTTYTATVPYATTSMTVTPTTTDANATVTVNGTAVTSGSASTPINLAVGPNIITTVVTAQDGTTIETYTVTVTKTEPTIVATGSLSALTTIYGTPSASGSFNVSGSDMSEGILVSAPTGFEVSTDDAVFSDTVTIGAAGTIASTPVYIRLKGTIPVSSYSGNVVLTSANATTVNVATVSSTVTPAALTITADDKTKVYGTINPVLTVSYSGFVNGDDENDLTTATALSTTADLASPVGTYPITGSGATSSNYTISYVDGNLSVTPAALTVTADDQTKVYGSANPTLTVTYSGFVNGDTEASLTTAPTISTTADAASAVGNYPITASGAVSANYTFTYVDGNLAVTPAVLTITADDQSKVYGSVNPTLTATYTGFVNGDTESSLTTAPTISTTADAASAVGNYPITANGAVSANYTFTYVDGNLTVTPANLTITAESKTKVFGSANPALTASYAGFVNGDDEADLSPSPTLSTTAVLGSPVGNYPITPSGAVNPNYTISYTAGTLIVTPATLTITADDQTKVYGAANPTLTATYTGFVNGDTEASLTTPAIISTTADAASPVGNYPITVSGATSSNYTISYVDGNLTVTSVALTITANDQTKIYGSANPTLTVTYSGFVNGDTESSLTTAPTISTTADAASAVGTYPITVSGAVSSNYTISYVNGTLLVDPANLAIAADNKTKIYGEANPAFTVTYTGFVNGDDATVLTTPPVVSTTADATSPR